MSNGWVSTATRALLAAALCAATAPAAPTPQAAPAGEPVVPVFTDVTATSGIAFRHASGRADEKRWLFEAKGGGVGALDYDGDGWIDLYLVQGSSVERARAGDHPHGVLLRNRGDWTFEDVTERAGLTRGGWGMGVSAGDYDNDGHVDLYLANLGPNVLYRNRGDGTFEDVSETAGVDDPRWSTSAAFADYDGDGLLDLYVANYLDAGPEKLPREGCRYRGTACMCGPLGLPGAASALYRQGTPGRFTDVSAESGVTDPEALYGLGVVWGDADGDGDPDLFVANDSTPNAFYENRGGGRFEERGFASGLALSGMGAEQASMGVDLADSDNDGDLDAYATHFASDYSTLYRNRGGLEFEDVTAEAGIKTAELPLVSWGTRFVDLNHDGWKDLFHANGHVYPFLEESPAGRETYRQPASLYLNRGDGRFRDASAFAGEDLQRPVVGRGAAFADLDEDGDVDVVVAVLDGPPQLLRNDLAPGPHWVAFRAVGRESNRDGIGARIEVTAGGLSQVWEVKRTVGLYSCSDPRAHFGLGDAARIDRVEVRWPSGRRQEFRDVAADRQYVVDEEAGLSERAAAGARAP